LEGAEQLPPQEALERAFVANDASIEARTRSLLRASLGARLALVAVAVGALWLAVYWALT
jgi:hypothetical protein